MDKIIILCDSVNGVYIPKIMVKRLFDAGWSNITEADVNYFNSADPYDCDDRYWFDWDRIVEKTEYDDGGVVFTLHHDGDLFAIALDAMTEEEIEEFFGY